jgi:hypothetical protein
MVSYSTLLLHLIWSIIWTVDKNSAKDKAEICGGFDLYHIFWNGVTVLHMICGTE